MIGIQGIDGTFDSHVSIDARMHKAYNKLENIQQNILMKGCTLNQYIKGHQKWYTELANELRRTSTRINRRKKNYATDSQSHLINEFKVPE